MNLNKIFITCIACSMSIAAVNAQTNYRDLNRNGIMDDYENKNLSPETRATDLLSKMTLKEKVGAMYHTYSAPNKDGEISSYAKALKLLQTDSLIRDLNMTHFNLIGDVPAIAIAKYNNMLQKVAENTRLGIPVTFSSDPRSSFKPSDESTTISAGDLTPFPEAMGLAATRDTYATNEVAKAMAEEYRAIGISMLLNPMADLSTEPRWSRLAGTFGEDANLSSDMIFAYIRGFQGEVMDNKSVACITKHFPGNGPVKDGWESHFSYGRWLAYPGKNFDYHLQPFKAAISAGTAGIMTCYGIPQGIFDEEVGTSFNRQIMTDLLKEKMGFDGIVVSDWNVITEKSFKGKVIMGERSWGMEGKITDEKLIALIQAGVDQIGGETAVLELADLIAKGKVPMSLIDASVFKIMTLKFKLGLFDNPYVDETKVSEIVGSEKNKHLSKNVQEKSIVLLENKENMYPLTKGKRIYVEGYDQKEKFAAYGTIVNNIDECDIAIIKLSTPYGPPKSDLPQEKTLHQGTLSFSKEQSQEIVHKLKAKPSVVVINLDRAAVIPEIAANVKVLLAEFGVSEEALLNILFGNTAVRGKLPIELPSSMDAVLKQKEDVPHDSEKPLYTFGFGL